MKQETDKRNKKTINRWLVISVAIYIILVLNLFEPFGITINGFILVYHLILSTYGMVSALTLGLTLFLLTRFSVVLHSSAPMALLGWLMLLVLLVSFSNWLYSQLLHYTISGWHNMYVPIRSFKELMPQFLVLYSLWGMVSWVLIRMLQQSTENHESVLKKFDESIKLYSENQSDVFKVKPQHIVCFKTSDNYLEVYYVNEDNQLQNRMIRSSMKKMVDSLNADDFYRAHQSFLVNIAHIKGLKKVKNNHFLEMSYLDFDVSIARKNVKNIRSFIIN